MEYWVNIDLKEDLYRLHKSSCMHVLKSPSKTKGVNEIKAQGGWLRFKTWHMARAFYQRNYHTLQWKPCQICNPL